MAATCHSQYSPRQRQMAEADGIRDEFIEDRGLKLQAEKFCIVRKQGGIEIPLDGRQVERIVFKARMVARDPQGENGKRSQQRQIRDRGVALARCGPRRILPRLRH